MSPACSEPPLSRFAGQHELVGKAGKLLDKAELEVVKLMKTADGTPAETEYERDDV